MIVFLLVVNIVLTSFLVILLCKVIAWLKFESSDDTIIHRKKSKKVIEKLKTEKKSKVYKPSRDPYSEFNGGLDDWD